MKAQKYKVALSYATINPEFDFFEELKIAKTLRKPGML